MTVLMTLGLLVALWPLAAPQHAARWVVWGYVLLRHGPGEARAYLDFDRRMEARLRQALRERQDR